MSKNIDELLFKTDDKSVIESNNSPKLKDAIRRINGICKSLSIKSQNYLPEQTLKSVKEYIETPNGIDRIMYSHISHYVFSLDRHDRGTFSTNISNLLQYVLDDNNKIDEKCCKMVIKLYDHFQLAISQIENVHSILAIGIDDAKDELSEETKGIEKEYVTILGIFAAIVLAFVGGLVFSSSALQNIHKVSIYKISIVVLMIGLVLCNIIFGLFYYIDRIVKTKKEPRIKPLIVTDVVILILMVCVFFTWKCGLIEKRNISVDNIVNDVNTLSEPEESVYPIVDTEQQ